MQKTQMYAQLDALIISAVAQRHDSPLNDRDCIREAAQLEKQYGGEDFRYIDRRLQALRKQKIIQYLGKREAPTGKAGWYMVEN